MNMKYTFALLALSGLAVGCASNDRADYENRDVHPRTYSSQEAYSATSDLDKTPSRSDTSEPYKVDPDGRIVADRQDEQLKLGPQTQLDQQLAQRIRQTLNDDDQFQSETDDMRITVRRGRVTLNGWVNSEAEKARAEEIARDFNGVNFVDNRLRIGDPHNRF